MIGRSRARNGPLADRAGETVGNRDFVAWPAKAACFACSHVRLDLITHFGPAGDDPKRFAHLTPSWAQCFDGLFNHCLGDDDCFVSECLPQQQQRRVVVKRTYNMFSDLRDRLSFVNQGDNQVNDEVEHLVDALYAERPKQFRPGALNPPIQSSRVEFENGTASG